MSNFTRFNHKSLINPGYQDSEQYVPLKDIPFKKAADLFAINPEMVYSMTLPLLRSLKIASTAFCWSVV